MSAATTHDPVDDARVVTRCRSGEAEAWRELVERFSRYVYAICTRAYGLPPEDAQDVFQDVFARAYERLDSLREPTAIRPWLGQLARRACLDHIRSARGTAALDELDVSAVDRELERIEEAVAVRHAMSQLSATCQEVLDRFFCRDHSYHTIGQELNLPAGTIASRISRCLAKLRAVYEGRSDGPEAS